MYVRRSEDVLDVLDLERFGSDSNTFTYRVTLLELSSSCNKFLTLRIFYSQLYSVTVIPIPVDKFDKLKVPCIYVFHTFI